MSAPGVIEDVGQYEPVALRTYAVIEATRVSMITRAHGDSTLRAMPNVEAVIDITDRVGPLGPGWWWDGAAFTPPNAS